MASDFAEVLNALLEREEGGVTSARELARRLHDLDGRQSVSSWASSIKRYRRRQTQPREATIGLFARAFRVDRATFPPASGRPTVSEVADRLAALEARVEQLASQREVREGLETLRAAIDQLASRGTGEVAGANGT